MSQFENGQRFSIFDALAAAGIFRANPANADSRAKDGTSLYKGPVEYPKMLYFPRQIVTVPASAEVGPLAGQYSGMSLNEQRAMQDKIVNDLQEEQAALAEGWFLTPVEAIEALNEKREAKGLEPLPVPPVSSAIRVGRLETEKEKLEKELEQAKRQLEKYQSAEAVRTKEAEDKELLAIPEDLQGGSGQPQAAAPQSLLRGLAKSKGLV